MTQHITAHRANLIGSLWMVAAMAGFAVEDALIKAAALTMPSGQIMVLFGLGGAVVFAGLSLIRRAPLFHAAVISRPMLIRSVFEVVGRLFYVLAITLTPLSAATVILQATPVVVVAAAALLFGERVGWRKWMAIAIGLAGVLMIVQPGSEGFSLLSVLAVIGMLGFAGRDLASRAAPASLGTLALGFYGFLAILLAGVIFAIVQGQQFVWPGPSTALILLAIVLAGAAAYSCLMRAMRTGEVGAVTPFRYSRLLFGIAIGVGYFGERFSLPMALGSALIVLAGLFLLWRGKGTRR
ncbi:MAG: EamA family transporter [Rhodobacterales bacterium]|nr:MAG: EamA family transporter [Rhodobacterales bacterium]